MAEKMRIWGESKISKVCYWKTSSAASHVFRPLQSRQIFLLADTTIFKCSTLRTSTVLVLAWPTPLRISAAASLDGNAYRWDRIP